VEQVTNRPNWQITVDQYRARARQLEERAAALFTRSALRSDAEEALRVREQARSLAMKATQIESFYLHGEVYSLGK
jgi:hypothetical protein